MYENTILNALKQYRTYLQIENGFNEHTPNSSLINHIQDCEEFIEKGNELTYSWMVDNHSAISKAVKYADNSILQNYAESDNEELGDERKKLNLCVEFFKNLYKKLNIDDKYMDIDF